MEAQLKAVGIAYQKHAGEIDHVIQKTSRLAALDDEDLQDAFTGLARTTGNVNQALKDTALAADIARGKNISLEAATTLVTKAELGKAGALTKAGIEVDKNATKMELLDTLHKKFAGAAESYGQTAAGAQERVGIAVENLQERLGGLLLPAVAKVAGGIADLIPKLETWAGEMSDKLRPTIEKVTGFIQDNWPLVTKVFDATVTFIRQNVFPIFHQLYDVAREVVGKLRATFEEHRVELTRIFNNLRDIFRTTFMVLKAVLENIVIPVLQFAFTEVLPRVIGVAIGVIDKLVSVWKVMQGAVVTVIGVILKAIDLFLGGIQAMFSAASHLPLIGGKFKGIESAIGDVRGSVRGLKTDIDKLQGKTVAVKVNLRYSEANTIPGRNGDGIIGADGLMPIVEGDIAALGQRALAFSGGRTSGTGGASAGGLQPQILDDLALARSWGLGLSSGYRPGAITSTGHVSLHASGRAIDVSGAPSNMAAFARAEAARFHSSGIREILYTPLGGYYGGGWTRLSGKLASDHYSHVHVGVYDQGGLVPPGLSMVINKTGAPEVILPINAMPQVLLGGSGARSLFTDLGSPVFAGGQLLGSKFISGFKTEMSPRGLVGPLADAKAEADAWADNEGASNLYGKGQMLGREFVTGMHTEATAHITDALSVLGDREAIVPRPAGAGGGLTFNFHGGTYIGDKTREVAKQLTDDIVTELVLYQKRGGQLIVEG